MQREEERAAHRLAVGDAAGVGGHARLRPGVQHGPGAARRGARVTGPARGVAGPTRLAVFGSVALALRLRATI